VTIRMQEMSEMELQLVTGGVPPVTVKHLGAPNPFAYLWVAMMNQPGPFTVDSSGVRRDYAGVLNLNHPPLINHHFGKRERSTPSSLPR